MNFFKKLLSFDDFVTPVIIKILYYIFAVVVIIIGLFQIFGSFGYGGGSLFISGLLTILLGPILVRVYFEILIVLFKIYEKLSIITSKLENSNPDENNITL